jgi:AraC-like DNA-binding protein
MIISIQKMTPNLDGYFRYFTSSPEAASWGLEMTACGRSVIPPGAVYPPPGHPEDHHFEWRGGRVLEALQVVWIREGSGQLELGRGRRETIAAGTIFALPPGVWHRYRPDPEQGWSENWVEVRGPLVERLLARGAFTAENHRRRAAACPGLEAALEAVHSRACEAGPGFSPLLAALAMEVVAQWVSGPRSEESLTPLQRAVLAAERELAVSFRGEIPMEDLARRLGVAYSHFRRAFKAHTGFAPWQYVLHLRLTQARRLLAGSVMGLEEIAQHLGFSSAFHLSAAFKKAYGIAPDPWRRQLRETQGAIAGMPEDNDGRG